jgi:hypothetical protein
MILLAVTLSGCSGQQTSTPTPAAIGPTATPTKQAGGVVDSVKSLFDRTKFNWFEYKYTTIADGKSTVMNMKIEYAKETYNGVPAKRSKMEMKMAEQDTITIVDVYTAESDGRTLGGHMKMVVGGQTLFDQDIPAEQTGSYSGQDPTYTTETGEDYKLPAGTVDTVTVPAGTFVCTKYSVDSKDAKQSWWVAPNVPLPVKFASESANMQMTGELVGWG